MIYHHWRKTFIDQIDTYIALSNFSREKFIEGGLPGEKITVKPNFVHSAQFNYNKTSNYVLFIGRISNEKGIDTLLESWTLLSGIPIKCIGVSPSGISIKSVHQGEKSIEMLGRLDHANAISYLISSRFLIVPSQTYENFPLVIAEAFACGVPVIASRLGAMAEIVEDGKTGLLFTPGDAEDLAAKVEWAWNHTAEMAEMGKAARREYEEKYTAERNYQMLMEIYQKAIENHRRQR